jgi:hypothetical protein
MIMLRSVCSFCAKVLVEGAPGAETSHGCCPACWVLERAKAGLAPKPFPGRKAA